MTKEELKHRIKYYEQCFFTYDSPVPFKNNKLPIYPVLVKNYYLFYTLIDCFTIDKNADISGIGIGMSNLDFLFHLMTSEENGKEYTSKLIDLIELIFNIKNGIKCGCDENNDTFEAFEDIYKELEYIKEEDQKFIFFNEKRICKKCGQLKEDIIRYKPLENGKKNLMINNVEINKQDFDELRQVVCQQNIPDYEDDYIDPELKAELEEVGKLKNPNMVQPTLEKQMSCIVAGSNYKYEELPNMSIRKFVMLLRTIDSMLHYFAYKQGEMSGIIKFSGELDHWIYSKKDDKFKDIVELNKFKEKMKDVT